MKALDLLGVFRFKTEKTDIIKKRTAPEFGIGPVLWREAAFSPIDEDFPLMLRHPAQGCTGMKNDSAVLGSRCTMWFTPLAATDHHLKY